MTVRKTILLSLVLGAAPAAAFAAGGHSGGHEVEAHPMAQSQDGRATLGPMHDGAEDATAGMPGDPAKADRVVEITMHDTMRFTPDRIDVKAGETVRLFVRNPGKLRHEMVIGSMKELKEHAALMRRMPNMHHAEPNMLSLAPGQRGSIVWRFDKPGEIHFACLQPGHMESGMVGEVQIR